MIDFFSGLVDSRNKPPNNDWIPPAGCLGGSYKLFSYSLRGHLLPAISMNHNRDAIEAGYRYCRQMSRRAGSSFHAGFMLLPAEKRRAMWALYAFMRHTDDLADAPPCRRPLNGQAMPDGHSPRDALAEWRAALDIALQLTDQVPLLACPAVPHATDRSALLDKPAVAPGTPLSSFTPPPPSFFPHPSSLLPALADAVCRFGIPPEHLHAVIGGVEMDLDGRRYETFDALRQYCERVASAVGMACIHIWGFRGRAAFEPARAAGVALQLTNILRDLREDAAAGRLYLPLADMQQCGYSFDDLCAGVVNQPFLRLMNMEIDRAKQHYRVAEGLTEHLHPDGRKIFGAMTATYRELLRRIERRPADVLRRRIRVGPAAKLRILVRWSLFPPCKADPS